MGKGVLQLKKLYCGTKIYFFKLQFVAPFCRKCGIVSKRRRLFEKLGKQAISKRRQK